MANDRIRCWERSAMLSADVGFFAADRDPTGTSACTNPEATFDVQRGWSKLLEGLAPQVGFEPITLGLTGRLFSAEGDYREIRLYRSPTQKKTSNAGQRWSLGLPLLSQDGS